MKNKKESENYKKENYQAGIIGFCILAIVIFFEVIDYSKIIYEFIILGGLIVSLIVYLCICIWKNVYNPAVNSLKILLFI